nr:restriction endonuclease subunit S [Deinococcus sp. GbtcB9]
MFSLPQDWHWRKLEEVQAKGKAIVSGPFGSNISSKYFVSEGIPVIRGNNLTLDLERFVDNGFVFLTREKAKEFSNCEAVSGDILFTAAGTIGQVGIIPNSSRYPKYIISNKQLRARLDKSQILPIFAFYWLSSPRMRDHLIQRNTGSSVPLINHRE